MAEKRVFRQAALDRLASPDQLDRLLPVADRHGWAALAVLGALAAALAAWSMTGSIPVTQSAQGILAAGGGQASVVAAQDGGPLRWLVAAGDQVRAGQPLADIGGRLHRAPAAARILELKQPQGATLRPGDPLLALESGDPLRPDAILFAPADRGRLAAPGMPVLLSPAGTRGTPLHGTVASVSPAPLSHEAQAALLGNASLADAFGPGPRYALRVRLAPGSASPAAGTLVSGAITLRRQRPADLLMPGR